MYKYKQNTPPSAQYPSHTAIDGIQVVPLTHVHTHPSITGGFLESNKQQTAEFSFPPHKENDKHYTRIIRRNGVAIVQVRALVLYNSI